MLTSKKQFQIILFALIAIVSMAFQGFSQMDNNTVNAEPCYFDNYVRQHKQLANAFEKKIQHTLNSNRMKMQSGNVKNIPVVVHIIHNGGTENISDAQVQSQIAVLNEDFRKMAGTAGDGNGVDTEVEFCLAKITPDGKCTNGIVRIQSTLTNHQTYQRSMLKNLSYWDNTRYLNMYIVKSINGNSGTLGYSSFPGGPPDEDGIVVRHNYFGRIGTAAASLGRTTTHEISHWFGLYYTFNNSCGLDVCADGDYVCDTPPVASPGFNCPIINSCSNDFPDVNYQIQNYLDYTNDACKNMFTAGQKARMDATLITFREDIWQYTNIIATGCESNYVSLPCGAIADFTSNSQNICVGNPVLFTNKSLNNCTQYQWYFPGGTPSSSTAINPTVIYNAVGIYNVSLSAANVYGNDSISFTNFITVTTPAVGQAIPFVEGFETTIFPPNGILIDNPDGGITWERDSIAVPYSGLGSAKINNLINTNYGQSDALVLPNFDLTTFGGTPYLSFRWAYAKSDPSYSDELLALISNDCGVNFTQIFYRTGTAMTTGVTQTTPYILDSNTVWKFANISLSAYAAATNAIIKIVNVTDGGNNLYIDNINIGANLTGIEENEYAEYAVTVFPNPAKGITSIQYKLKQIENVSIAIYNTIGQCVYILQESKQQAGVHQISIDTETFGSASLYLLNINIGNKSISRKIISGE
jgi:PKD repeat protein